MAAQLEVKCVSSVGKGSKEWPFTPAPTQPDFGLYRASPGFGATGCSDTCSGVWLQDLTSQHGFSSPGGNIPFSPRDEKHFTAFPRGPAAFPRLKGDPADLKSHKRGHDIREVSSLNRSREALHIAQLHHRLRGGQGFLGRGAPSGGKNHGCPNKNIIHPWRKAGLGQDLLGVAFPPPRVASLADPRATQPLPPHRLGTAWLGTLPQSACPACLLARPELRGNNPFYFGHSSPSQLQVLSARLHPCHMPARGLAAGGMLLVAGGNSRHEKAVCK